LRTGLDTLDALDALAAPLDVPVVIHDALRPLATPELIATALAAALHGGVVVGGEPVKETIKRVRGGLVVATLPRERLVSVQTPAVLPRSRLRSLLNAPPAVTDTDGELAAALAASIPVGTYQADPENIRVAGVDELVMVEALLRRRGTT
jgi:2-C-methyl-D-erythritol 4-phosphate cytidylyltransferase